MKIQQTLLSAITKLRKAKTDSAHLDAEVLLASVLKKDRMYLHSHPEKKVSASQQRRFSNLVNRRLNNHPIAYLTGQKEFYKLNFLVDSNVLIPRPDTEVLVEEALLISRRFIHQDSQSKISGSKSQVQSPKFTIIDVGTGSGCIAITLAKYLPWIKLYMTDISAKALAMAKKNARLHKMAKKITFVKGDLLSPFQKKIQFDLVCANLPYLTTNETKNLPHEPKTALHGGKLGLELLDRLIQQLPGRLAPGGIALLEIAPSQVKAVDYFVERSLPDKKVLFIKDLSGRDRVAKIY
ncbi:MAG: peptide chain release factor N(5)-glutamine methyltransferase [Patescibacteria group bacterium]